MPARRILSLWFPRLAAERVLRGAGAALAGPLAVVAEAGNVWRLASLSGAAEAAGLRPGQPLRDALAMCPALIARPAQPLAEAAFLAALRRWAGRFSPWVAEEPPEGLMIDLTGCAHLFGGEAALMAEVEADCAALGLTVRAGLADTPGAAWALARFGGRAAAPGGGRSGDAIDQEARATRARAARRRGAGARAGDTAAGGAAAARPEGRIAPPGQTRGAIAPLPVAALRLPEGMAAELARLGLTRIADLAGLPRAALARRFGQGVLRRLDQALGLVPEPVGPARPAHHFAVRLGFPEPVGRPEDVLAAIDRMLPVLGARLKAAGHGARRLRLEAWRADGGVQAVEMGLARPAAEPDRLRPLLALKAAEIDPGFGLDRLRIEACATEPVHPLAHRGHLDAAAAALARGEGGAAAGAALDDLIGRLGARVGLEAITRLHPGDSHIPEKAGIPVAAAFAAPAAGPWPATGRRRPLVLLGPEAVTAPEGPAPPGAFRWRRRDFRTRAATGPERIAPEWWLDEPAWRSGPRDYWRVETEEGERLWLFYAHGGAVPGGWFCHGVFA